MQDELNNAETEKDEPEREYDLAWEEAGMAENLDNNEGLPEKAPEKHENVEVIKAEKVEKTEKPEKHVEDSLEKALKDTKAWATKLAMENAELKRVIEEFKKGNASESDVREAQDAVAKAQIDLDNVKKRVYEDYPELQELFDAIIERSFMIEREISELKEVKERLSEQARRKEALDYFNAYVKPEVLKVHPDFDDILFKTVDGRRIVNDEYFRWAEQQSPAMRFAAMDSSDPQDIIMAISAYKKFKATDEASDIKLRQEKEKKQRIANAMTLRGGGAPIPSGYKRSNPDDYESAWEEAEILLKKHGIG